MTVGETIKRIRQEKGLTQKQLGALCEPPIAESTIRRYELGKLNPKIETLQKIAKALGVYFFEFMNDEYFDVATDEEPGSLERESKFLEEKQKYIDELLQDPNISEQEKQKILNDHIAQTALMTNLHIDNAKLGRKYLLAMLFEQLNHTGQIKAIEKVEKLTLIPDYQKTGDFFKDNLPRYALEEASAEED